MRKWNKLLAMALAMAMAFGLAVTSFAEDDMNEDGIVPISDSIPVGDEETPDAAEAAGPDLSDVEEWAKEHVAAVVQQGLMDMDETGFRPEDKTTRVELVVALYRLAKSPSVEGMENKFEDIASLTEEQQAAIIWAASEKIVNGEEETVFNPNGNVERQQIAKILFVYAKAEAVEEDQLAGFPDKDEVEEYAVDFLNWLVAKGIMNGDDGLLKPAGDATRAQIATMLNRYITDVLSTEPAEPAEPAEGEDDTQAPAEDEETPDEGEEAPAEGEETPDEGEEAPAEGEETPDEGEEAPAEGEETPDEGEKAPAEGEETPDEAE